MLHENFHRALLQTPPATRCLADIRSTAADLFPKDAIQSRVFRSLFGRIKFVLTGPKNYVAVRQPKQRSPARNA